MKKVREQFNTVDYTWPRPREVGVGIHGKDTLVTNRGKTTPTWLLEQSLGQLNGFLRPKAAR